MKASVCVHTNTLTQADAVLHQARQPNLKCNPHFLNLMACLTMSQVDTGTVSSPCSNSVVLLWKVSENISSNLHKYGESLVLTVRDAYVYLELSTWFYASKQI